MTLITFCPDCRGDGGYNGSPPCPTCGKAGTLCNSRGDDGHCWSRWGGDECDYCGHDLPG